MAFQQWDTAYGQVSWEVTPSEMIDPFEGADDHNKNILLSMRPGKDDRVIL